LRAMYAVARLACSRSMLPPEGLRASRRPSGRIAVLEARTRELPQQVIAVVAREQDLDGDLRVLDVDGELPLQQLLHFLAGLPADLDAADQRKLDRAVVVDQEADGAVALRAHAPARDERSDRELRMA